MLEIDLDRVRAALGIGYTEGEAWFSLAEETVGFAPHKRGGHRAVILRRHGRGPVATVFARTSQEGSGCCNPPHDHVTEFSRCWLNLHGDIVLAVPLQIPASEICQNNYMCAEPDEATTRAVLAASASPTLRGDRP